MAAFVDICLGVIWLALTMLLSLDFAEFKLSSYDLNRLSSAERKAPRGLVALNVQDLYKLTQIKLIFLVSLFIVLLTWHRSWVGSLVIAIIALVFSLLMSQFKFVSKLTQKLLAKIPARAFEAIKYIKPILSRLKGLSDSNKSFKSKDELLDLIAHDEMALSAEQRKMLAHVLQFADKSVSANMVTRANIISVKQNDTLGPKLIDQLHNSGHSRFPVIKNSIDEIIGTLYLQDLRDVSVLEAGPKAKDLMRPQAYYIHESSTLNDALNAFLTTKHQQLFVINNKKRVVGLISLEDLLEQMIGQKSNDDFDHYDDAEAVIDAQIEAEQDALDAGE